MRLYSVTRRARYIYIHNRNDAMYVIRYVTIVPAEAERDLPGDCATQDDVVKMLQGIKGSGNVLYIRETTDNDMTAWQNGKRKREEKKISCNTKSRWKSRWPSRLSVIKVRRLNDTNLMRKWSEETVIEIIVGTHTYVSDDALYSMSRDNSFAFLMCWKTSIHFGQRQGSKAI